MEIAVIGREDFCLGFRLAGIKRIFETSQPKDAIAALRKEAGTTVVGIVIFDENLLGALNVQDRRDIEESLQPVYIMLSKTASEDSLKRMIKKSIGVDL